MLPSDVAAAKEQHQDVMLEILSREELAAQEATEEAKKAAHEARMRAANLEVRGGEGAQNIQFSGGCGVADVTNLANVM